MLYQLQQQMHPMLQVRLWAYQAALKSFVALSLRQELPPETMLWIAVSTPLQPEGGPWQLAGGLPQAVPVQNEHRQGA